VHTIGVLIWCPHGRIPAQVQTSADTVGGGGNGLCYTFVLIWCACVFVWILSVLRECELSSRTMLSPAMVFVSSAYRLHNILYRTLCLVHCVG
jgi:hypothetical protein